MGEFGGGVPLCCMDPPAGSAAAASAGRSCCPREALSRGLKQAKSPRGPRRRGSAWGLSNFRPGSTGSRAVGGGPAWIPAGWAGGARGVQPSQSEPAYLPACLLLLPSRPSTLLLHPLGCLPVSASTCTLVRHPPRADQLAQVGQPLRPEITEHRRRGLSTNWSHAAHPLR